MIRAKYKDIGWVSAQIDGTYLIITIKENVKYDINKEKQLSGNIIASEDGIVETINLRNGEAKVKTGDSVKKGDILVSGVIDILNDAGEIVSTKVIRADADVYIKYDKEYYYEYDRKYNKRKYTNNKRKNYKFWWDKKELVNVNFYLPFIKEFDNYDVMINNYNVSLCKKLYTPVELVCISKMEYKNVECEYTDKELREKAIEGFNKYRKELMEQDKEIIDNNIEYITHKLGIIAKGYVVIRQKEKVYNEYFRKVY